MQRHQVQLAAGEFSYVEHGHGDPVVLLHALGREAGDWAGVMEALGDRFRCLALDQRGHGRSVRPAGYEFPAMAGDVGEFAEALGLERFALIGHSMGGTVAWLFARYHGDRLSRLVLEDTAPPRPGDEWPEVPPDPPEEVPYDWEARRQIFRQLADPDPAWWARISAVTVPTLILSGSSPNPRLVEAASLLPAGRLVTIPAGHWIHESDLASFLAEVTRFLGG